MSKPLHRPVQNPSPGPSPKRGGEKDWSCSPPRFEGPGEGFWNSLSWRLPMNAARDIGSLPYYYGSAYRYLTPDLSSGQVFGSYDRPGPDRRGWLIIASLHSRLYTDRESAFRPSIAHSPGE